MPGLCVISSASSVVSRLWIASTSIRSNSGFSSASRTSCSTRSPSTEGVDAAASAERASRTSVANRSTTRCSTSERPTASGSGPAMTPSSARSASSVSAPRPACATARTGRNAKRPIFAVRPPSSRSPLAGCFVSGTRASNRPHPGADYRAPLEFQPQPSWPMPHRPTAGVGVGHRRGGSVRTGLR